MSTRLERWSRPAELPVAAWAAAFAVGLFCASWATLHVGFFTHHPVEDTPLYQRYGDAMVGGNVPYRDFSLEYPPAALPAFLIPAPGDPDQDTYRQRFEWTMLLCGAVVVALVAVALAGVAADAARTTAALAFVGLAPLAVGPVILTRFDLWPTALMVGALAAVLWRRLRLGAGLLGLGFAAKIFPALLLPLVLAYAWRRRGRREAIACAAIFAGVAIAIFLPFVVLSPGGVWHSVLQQGNRPLQIESLGAAALLALHHLFGFGVTMTSSHGSQNLGGKLPNGVAALQSVLQAAGVVAIWVWFARGPATPERLVRASAAVLVAFIALGKVLSPQFLIWLIPLVPLVRGRRGVTSCGLLALAWVLTQTWFPYRYWAYALHFDALASWTVLARDLVLVALLAVLVWPAPPALDGNPDRLAR